MNHGRRPDFEFEDCSDIPLEHRKKGKRAMTHGQGQKLGISLAAAFLTVSCGNLQQASPGTPRARLTPQSEGTPLAPRDPRMADHWPPELKQAIDDMLSLYPREGQPLGVGEVEKKMGVTLTELPLPANERRIYKSYRVTGSQSANADPKRWTGGLLANYTLYRAHPPVGMTQSFDLAISVSRLGFCLDPYELAVYTGSKFVNGETASIAKPRSWPPAYVWGMFEWSARGHYAGRNFRIIVDRARDAAHRPKGSNGCVVKIGVLSDFTKEPRLYLSEVSPSILQ